MKDQVLQGYLTNFSKQYEYENLQESKQFEHFVNYTIVSRQYPREFDVNSISVGGENDMGFDGVAIIVNGNIVQDKAEIEYLVKQNGFLDVYFLFIQAKLSAKFDGAEILNTISGLKSFFDNEATIPENPEMQNLREIKDIIYENSISLNSAPKLDLYYVTTGEWNNPVAITGKVNQELKYLKDTGLFSNIENHYIDANKLKEMYREINKKSVKEINFQNRTVLPEIQSVKQSFIGSISTKEFISLITDSDGNLQKNIFEDNIRHFQGNNKVNNEIKKTLLDLSLQTALVILNNGITVIAKKLEPIGNKIKITDFQIVNGCQSSHVLFNNKEKLDNNTHIVIKLIETTDQELTTRIIKATNKQTLVTDEAFESLSAFHKDLEEYYKARAIKSKNPIYYERRSKQYEGDSIIKPSQIVSLTMQIKSYIATVLAQPHSIHRYYGELLEANRTKMFKEGDKNFELYYIPSLLLNQLERLFNNGVISRFYKPFKFHLIYIAYVFFQTLRKIEKLNYDIVIDKINDHHMCRKLFIHGTKIIDGCLKTKKISIKEATRSKEFTEEIKNNLDSELDMSNFG